MAVDITTKISEMDNFDEKIKQALDKTLNETTLGQRVMEVLTGGLHTQGEELAGLKDDLRQTVRCLCFHYLRGLVCLCRAYTYI